MDMNSRRLQRIIPSVPTSDGAGVRLRRSIGTGDILDPFLMLDEFSSEDADDYIAGFPPHPHRGFETVTYMLAGHMRHEDHLGNVGELKSGGVQWMTAGRGVIHSEMPQQEYGLLHGFQLWINLPAAEKMKPAAYSDIPSDLIPIALFAGGGLARVIAGSAEAADGTRVAGPIQGLSTEPVYLDVFLPEGAVFRLRLPAAHAAFVYPYEGSVIVGAEDDERALEPHSAGVLSAGELVRLRPADGPARFLFLAGRPLDEPVAQHGPFVMNTPEEIEQAIADYSAGRLAGG
jgi:redox-sensitive bicupin YhaK (pirin superfamily)